MAQADERYEKLAARLWPAGQATHAYAILDAASCEGLLDKLYGKPRPWFECLFTGDLSPDMAHVAPYLAAMDKDGELMRWAVDDGWGQHWGVFLRSQADLPTLWRSLRTLTRIYDAEGRPVYFRFYDPRVLRRFLPTCSPEQLHAMFKLVDRYILESENPGEGLVYSLAGDGLACECFQL